MKKFFAFVAATLFAGSMMAATTMTCADAAAAALSVSANNELYNNGEEIEVTGYVTFIQTAYSDQYHNITFWMADAADGGKVLEAYRAACASEADAPAVGDQVKVTGKLTKYNTTPEFAAACTYVILSSATPVEPEMDYYVVGSMSNWGVNEIYKLAPNTETAGEYMGTFFFSAGAEFKVVYSDGSTVDDANWFPTGMGNNKVVATEGIYKVYFRPDGQGGDGWHYGYIYMEEVVEPVVETVTVAEAITAGMALDSMGVSETTYAVEGYVINPGAFSMTYKNQSWYMADDATATASDFQAYNCYAIQGLDTLKVLAGDKVKLVGKLKKYYNKSAAKYIIEIEKGDASFITMAEGDHTVVTTTETATVAQALAIGAALADNGVTEKQYTITGYISAEGTAYSDQYKNQSFWVADDATSTAASNADGAFYVYRGKPETEEALAVGTKVQFTCTIKKYVKDASTPAVVENADQNIIIKVLGSETPVEEADVVFTSAEFNGLGTSGTGSEVTVTKDGVTFTCDKAFGDQYGVRCYKTSNVTITSAEQQIGKIVFEFATVSGTYYNGGLEDEIVVNGMSWNAQNLSMQARMNKVKIYFGEYEPIVVDIDTVTVAQAVEIGMALADNTTTEKEYVVKGWVVQAYAPNEGYTDQTWFMADEQGAYGTFEAYQCTPDYLVENDQYVYVKGKIQKYVKDEKVQIEIGKGTATHAWGQGIENVVLTEKVQKVMVDGVLYIVRDNKMFNVQGAQVR